MYRASLHCFSCDGLGLCVKQSWNCHSFHLNIWGETGETLGHTELSFSLNLCLQIRSVSPSRDGRMECKQGNSVQHKGSGMGRHFLQHFQKFLLQNLPMFSFFAIAVSELKWAAGGGCCPMIVCGRWPALGASMETSNMHIWTSRWQTFGMFCQKARWFGTFPEAHAPSCFHWCPS